MDLSLDCLRPIPAEGDGYSLFIGNSTFVSRTFPQSTSVLAAPLMQQQVVDTGLCWLQVAFLFRLGSGQTKVKLP
jgi:hypothetical protein